MPPPVPNLTSLRPITARRPQRQCTSPACEHALLADAHQGQPAGDDPPSPRFASWARILCRARAGVGVSADERMHPLMIRRNRRARGEVTRTWRTNAREASRPPQRRARGREAGFRLTHSASSPARDIGGNGIRQSGRATTAEAERPLTNEASPLRGANGRVSTRAGTGRCTRQYALFSFQTIAGKGGGQRANLGSGRVAGKIGRGAVRTSEEADASNDCSCAKAC